MQSINVTTDLTVPVSEQDHIQGSLEAPVVLIEYGDYECPYCAQAAAVVQELQNEMGDRLCYVFRNFPLTQVHPRAMEAAQAAQAAAAQGEFWQMHYCLYSYQSALSATDLLHYARDLDLDVEQFSHDLLSEDRLRLIHYDMNTGIESGVEGTPCFFINGIRYNGSWKLDDMREKIGILLKVSHVQHNS